MTPLIEHHRIHCTEVINYMISKYVYLNKRKKEFKGVIITGTALRLVYLSFYNP